MLHPRKSDSRPTAGLEGHRPPIESLDCPRWDAAPSTVYSAFLVRRKGRLRERLRGSYARSLCAHAACPVRRSPTGPGRQATTCNRPKARRGASWTDHPTQRGGPPGETRSARGSSAHLRAYSPESGGRPQLRRMFGPLARTGIVTGYGAQGVARRCRRTSETGETRCEGHPPQTGFIARPHAMRALPKLRRAGLRTGPSCRLIRRRLRPAGRCASRRAAIAGPRHTPPRVALSRAAAAIAGDLP